MIIINNGSLVDSFNDIHILQKVQLRQDRHPRELLVVSRYGGHLAARF